MKKNSRDLLLEALRVIPGGVNSPVRAGRAVGIDPPFIQRADGCFLWDVEGTRYIDYVGSWGPMILGHRPPEVIQAINEALENGTSYGAPTEQEVNLATMIVETVPSVEMVRMVNSGTEAAMSAIRLARAFTGRDTIVKFDGCYHGHSDSFLVNADHELQLGAEQADAVGAGLIEMGQVEQEAGIDVQGHALAAELTRLR